MLQVCRQELIDCYTETGRVEDVMDESVRRDVDERQRVIHILRDAIDRYAMASAVITCHKCHNTGGMHYGNCPAATPDTMIKGPEE